MLEQKNKQPFFSVLVPVYNGALFVSKCIDSILSQTFKDFELIVCDDASTDKTPEILKEYQAKDSRVQILSHDNNKRALITRNDLIRAAAGKYCILADADDELLPDYLERANQILIKKHYDIIQFSYLTAGTNSTAIKNLGNYSDEEYFHDEILKRYLFGFPSFMVPFAKVFDREMLLKSLPEDRVLPFIDDIPLTIRAAFYAKSFLSLKEKKYIFHYGSGRFSKQKWDLQNIQDFCKSSADISKEFLHFSEKNRISIEYSRKLEEMFADNLFIHVENLDPSDKADALRSYLQYFDGRRYLKDFVIVNKNLPLSAFIKYFRTFSFMFLKRTFLRIIGKKKWGEP